MVDLPKVASQIMGKLNGLSYDDARSVLDFVQRSLKASRVPQDLRDEDPGDEQELANL